MTKSIEQYLIELDCEIKKLKLNLELWECGAMLHDNHFKHQNDLEGMIRSLIFSEKNCINASMQHEAIKLISKKKPRCSSTN